MHPEISSASIESDKEALAACEAKAAEDWERFLLLRAKELKPGGVLLAVMVGRGAPGGAGELDKTFNAGSKVVVQGLLGALQDLVQNGSITEEEASSVNCPAFARTEDELKQPFVDPCSPVRKAGLILTDIRPLCVPCPNERQQREGRLTKAGMARKTALTLRTWSYPLIYNALSSRRTESERRQLTDYFYNRVAERLALGYYPYPYSMVVLNIQKVKVHDIKI